MSNRDIVVICAAAAAAALSCGFDETGVPPLPDEVLHFSESDGDGNGGGGGGGNGGGGCKREEPTLSEFGASDGALTGTWARRLVMKTERETRGAGAPWFDSSWTVHELVTVAHAGARMREVVKLCEITMSEIDGAVTGFPAAFLQSLPILSDEGEYFSNGETGAAGSSYKSPQPFVRLYGLKPGAATKAWEDCKSYFDPDKLAEECPLALWPEIFDMDCDGNTGVTLDMTVGTAATEQVYMVQRDTMTRTGTVKSADRIEGTMTLVQDNANLGSTKAMLKSNPPSRVVEGGSTFVMVRLPDGAACSAVKGAAF